MSRESMPLETKIYQKENKISLLNLLKDTLSDTRRSLYLAKQLTVRDLKAQYRQSYFGIIWAFIAPLTTAFVWIFLNYTGTIKLTDTGIAYPVFAFSGTLIWSIINSAINMPLSSTNASKGIMAKINFPKEALIVSGIYRLLFDSSIKVALLLAFVFIFGVGFHMSLLLLPFVVLGAMLFGITIGLFITPLGMLYTDVMRVVSMGLSLLMYVTPVVYVIPKTGLLKTIMELNPFTALIVTSRDFIVGADPSFLYYYLWIMLACIPLFLLGLIFYRISIPIFLERMSA
ncbi:ABC transporter permease [Thalassobellus suaedae]|uniref:ABC transporter permease n=1 Tax=Thalassobellus suaedae TaxID=3074124 RepID=A0ABY9Y0Y2_9FLAO|nr:ABC transporter permease [Flavobacteriaceae bacterium HL-DH10]